MLKRYDASDLIMDGVDGIKAAVSTALEVGYRHIDTARVYGTGRLAIHALNIGLLFDVHQNQQWAMQSKIAAFPGKSSS